MSVNATLTMGFTVSELLATGVASAASPKINHDAYNLTANLHASSTPPATEFVGVRGTFSGSTATLDLSSIVGANGTYDLTAPAGQRIQALMVYNPSGSNTLRIEDHGTNGYPLFGDTSAFVTLGPGGRFLHLTNDYCDGSGNNLDSTHKQLLLTGTSGQEYVVQILVG